MNKNEHIYQIFVTLSSSLNFLLKFCGDDQLIEIISTKFHDRIHLFTSQNGLIAGNWEWVNDEVPNPSISNLSLIRVPLICRTSVTLSNFNLSSSSLITGNWDVRFTVRNPNHKITLAYDHIEAYVFYQSDAITETSVPPFVQGTKNETEVRATFAALSAYVDQKVGDRIAADRARGSVNFNVRMLARVRFRAGAWRARKRLLSVVCGDLSVTVSLSSNGGSLVGGSRNCKVGL